MTQKMLTPLTNDRSLNSVGTLSRTIWEAVVDPDGRLLTTQRPFGGESSLRDVVDRSMISLVSALLLIGAGDISVLRSDAVGDDARLQAPTYRPRDPQTGPYLRRST
jgi:hypothetical protein